MKYTYLKGTEEAILHYGRALSINEIWDYMVEHEISTSFPSKTPKNSLLTALNRNITNSKNTIFMKIVDPNRVKNSVKYDLIGRDKAEQNDRSF